VRAAFYELDFSDKQTLASLVYAYFFGPQQYGLVRLIDSRTGKTIGSFSSSGLSLD